MTLLLGNGICLSGQDHWVNLSKYTTNEGLSSYNVRKIIQDRNGFIWVATQDGLNKFDGRTFDKYGLQSAPGRSFLSADIKDIVEDTATGLIWVLPSDGGLYAINVMTGEIVKHIAIPDDNLNNWHICLSLYRGHLYIGTFSGLKVFSLSSNKFLSWPDRLFSNQQLTIWSMLIDQEGRLWLGTNEKGLYVIAPLKEKVLYHFGMEALLDEKWTGIFWINAIVQWTANSVAVGTNKGLKQFVLHKSGISIEPLQEIFAQSFIQHIVISKKDHLLIATSDALYEWAPGSGSATRFVEDEQDKSSDWLKSVQYIHPDSYGGLWLGCQKGLAYTEIKPAAFRSYTADRKTGVQLGHVRSVLRTGGHEMLVGLRNGLANVNLSTGKIDMLNSGYLYHHLFKLKNNEIFASRSDGLYILNDTKLTPASKQFSELKPFSHFTYNSHLLLNDSVIILGTENDRGILVWKPGKKCYLYDESGMSLPSLNVNNVFCDKTGRVWILSDKYITLLDQHLNIDTVLSYNTTTGLSASLLFDVCEIPHGYALASYNGGVIILDNTFSVRKRFSSANGLSNDGTYQIFNYNDSLLVVTSNYGLSTITLNGGRIKNYYKKDGLHSDAFEEVAAIAAGDSIFAGGVDGFSLIMPSHFKVNKKAPELFVSKVSLVGHDFVKNSSDLQVEKLEIPNSVFKATVFFSALNFTDPAAVSYAYRLPPLQPEWISNGHQNFIDLIGLNPGTYTLQLKASNEDNIWSAPKRLTLILLPKWYQTLAFKLGLFLLTGGLFYLVYRYRITQLKRQEAIKSTIAADLHDDIGSTLTGLKIYTDLGLQENPDYYLQLIRSGVQDASISLRDTIWMLDTSNNNVGELLNRLERYAMPVTRAKGIHLTTDVPPELPDIKLDTEMRRNLYLILKEFINNSVKYAECDRITIHIQFAGKRLFFRIADNGRGFDATAPGAGNGLKNMQSRAEKAGFSFAYDTMPGFGTSLQLHER